VVPAFALEKSMLSLADNQILLIQRNPVNPVQASFSVKSKVWAVP
jgi:hypothetical protein